MNPDKLRNELKEKEAALRALLELCCGSVYPKTAILQRLDKLTDAEIFRVSTSLCDAFDLMDRILLSKCD